MIESTEFSLSTHPPRSRCAPTAVCAQFLVSVLFVMPSHDREKTQEHRVESSRDGYDDTAEFAVGDQILTGGNVAVTPGSGAQLPRLNISLLPVTGSFRY